ncbi:MAG: helix-turn-helix domain-containing protein [Patescibacteria group bacterium]
MLEKYLQDIGLGDKEATIYLSLLSVEHASVLDLAKKTKIKRPTVYVILESLAKKGLVSETTVGKKTHYYAEPPERLETFVEKRKLALEESQKTLKDIIPQIKSIQRESGEKPIVKYFEGREGIISTAEEIFRNDVGEEDVVYLIYPRDTLDQIFPESERKKFRKARLDKQIKSKVLYTYKKGEIPSDDTGERLKIDESKYPITCDIGIYKDKIRISVLDKRLSSVFIQSKDVADTLRSIFNALFDNIKNK